MKEEKFSRALQLVIIKIEQNKKKLQLFINECFLGKE